MKEPVAGGQIPIRAPLEELTRIKEQLLFWELLSGISVYKHMRNECRWARFGQHFG